MNTMEAVRLSSDGLALVIVDQTKLPRDYTLLSLTTKEEIFEAIKALRVRGAPAIGIAAAYGYYLGAMGIECDDYRRFAQRLSILKDYLASARPTAVNLMWALDRMEGVVHSHADTPVPNIKRLLRHEADAIKREDEAMCRSIGLHGLSVLDGVSGILTHCNAGKLATGGLGTALAPIYMGLERGRHFKVYADETRPLLQGARLTAFELKEAGVDVTLICDNMAASVMQAGLVGAVLVGCDRVAANGDTANKIGTLGVAILAQHHRIPFYVCAPSSTIDLRCASGADIPIEQRDPREVTDLWYEHPMAPQGAAVYNPAFDVTSHTLITAFITEHGVVRPPYHSNLYTTVNGR